MTNKLDGSELSEAICRVRGWIFAGGKGKEWPDAKMIIKHCRNDVETTCYYYHSDGTLHAVGCEARNIGEYHPHEDIAQAWQLMNMLELSCVVSLSTHTDEGWWTIHFRPNGSPVSTRLIAPSATTAICRAFYAMMEKTEGR